MPHQPQLWGQAQHNPAQSACHPLPARQSVAAQSPREMLPVPLMDDVGQQHLPHEGTHLVTRLLLYFGQLAI